MAEETQTKSSEPASSVEVVVTEKAVKEPPPPTPEPEEEPKKPAQKAPAAVAEADEKKPTGVDDATSAIPQSVSFKEESNLVSDLDGPEKKALDELKQLIQAALSNNEFTPPPPKEEEPTPPAKEEEPAPPAKGEEPAPLAKEEEPAPPAKEEEPAPPAKEEETAPPAKEEEPTPKAAEEKAVVVEDDGAKTVEAIEETVVPVSAAPPAPEAKEVTPPPVEQEQNPPEEVFIWGVPLIGDEKSDTILLKFLRARDFKVKETMAMIKNAVLWRKGFGIESLLEEDLGVPEMEKVVFMHGFDKEGHPVCYNVYGEFQNKELYEKTFADEEKRQRFLRWRVQFLEKGIRQQLDFNPGGVCTLVQITDLKNSPGLGKWELRQATKQALALLQDNYPEFAAKQVFINVPWWYLAVHRMISPFLTQRTKSKFVFAGPSQTSETLFKYIAPEQVPVQYGGLSKEKDPDFTTVDSVTEITIKPLTKQIIEIPIAETCLLVWELRVLGWDVSYGVEFVPSSEDGYTVIVQKARKLVASDEPVVKNSFKIGEPGKVILILDNTTSKKKKLLYRSKAKSSTESKSEACC